MNSTVPALPRGAAPPGTLLAREAARRLLTDAATLDLDRERLLVRCRLGVHTDWWLLDEAVELLALATGVWEVTGPDGTQLLVLDGYDRYSFDVS